MARSTAGVWRQHPDLIAITENLERHMRRRVHWLQPDTEGTFRFQRGHSGLNDLGERVYDMRVKYERNGSDHGDSSEEGTPTQR